MHTFKTFSKGLLILLLGLPMMANAQMDRFKTGEPESVQMSSDSLERMEDYLHNLVDESQIAGIQTAIMRKGKLIYSDSYGYSNIETGKMLDDKSIFRIFSMTKPIVSVGLMQLFEEGMFELDDPLYKFIPEFENMQVLTDSGLHPSPTPIRIIDLLRHSSGLNYGRGPHTELNQYYADAQVFSATTNEEFARRASQVPLQFEPGTDWQYGISTNICGYLIEVLSGKSLDIYLRECVLEPLGMNDTRFQVSAERVADFTVGYRWGEAGLVVAELPEESGFSQEVTLFRGGGGLVSTTSDYLVFCQMLLGKGSYRGKRILKKATVKLMLKDHTGEVRKHQDRLRLPRGEAGFGLGFAVKGESPDELKEVFGWGGAVGTYFKIDTQNDLAYLYMIQLSPYTQLGLRQSFQDFVNGALMK